jgi:hypothetical protein
MVIAVSSLIFLLAAACGLLTVSGSEWWVPLVIVGVYALILGGGFFGIFKLAKGMSRAPAGIADPPPALEETAEHPLTSAETAKLLEPLRLAMGAAIGLSFLSLIAIRFQTPGQGAFPLSQVPAFILYQLPFAAAFWLTRAGPDRKGIGLAMTFSAVSVLYGLWSWGALLFFYLRTDGFHPSLLISLADIAATGAAAFFAFQLWRRGPGTSYDIAILLGGIFGSMVYLGVVRFVVQLILMRGLGG